VFNDNEQSLKITFSKYTVWLMLIVSVVRFICKCKGLTAFKQIPNSQYTNSLQIQ